jgi:serine/threonine protein kinase
MDDFQILSVLGHGSMGKLVLAENRTTKERFAIKSVAKRHLAEGTRSKALIAERNVLMLVNNPFVVQLKFAFQSSSKFYLGLEYVSGGKLSRFLRPGVGVVPADARLFVAEIALALEHLHSFGMIYRDLSPDNVLIDTQGHAKLSDFSLAKALSDSEDGMARSFCGNFRYMAPEVFAGTGYSMSVDWWALGVLFCELLTGSHPFPGSSEAELLSGILQQEPRIIGDIDSKYVYVIQGLLKKDPYDRLNFEGIVGSPLFAGFDWEYVAEKRFVPTWAGQIAPSDLPQGGEVGLESIESSGKDPMEIEGFSYMAPFSIDRDTEPVVLDMALMEEYEDLAKDLD